MKTFIGLSLLVTISTALAASPIDTRSLIDGRLNCTVVSMKQTITDLGELGLNPFGKRTVTIDSSGLSLPMRKIEFGDNAWAGYYIYKEREALAGDYNFYLKFVDPQTTESVGFGNLNIKSSLVRIDEKRLKLKDKSHDVTLDIDFKSGKGLYRYSVKMGGWPVSNVRRHEGRVVLEDCRI